MENGNQTQEKTQSVKSLSIVLMIEKNQFELIEKSFKGTLSKQFPSKTFEKSDQQFQSASLAVCKSGNFQGVNLWKELSYKDKHGSFNVFVYVGNGKAYRMTPIPNRKDE